MIVYESYSWELPAEDHGENGQSIMGPISLTESGPRTWVEEHLRDSDVGEFEWAETYTTGLREAYRYCFLRMGGAGENGHVIGGIRRTVVMGTEDRTMCLNGCGRPLDGPIRSGNFGDHFCSIECENEYIHWHERRYNGDEPTPYDNGPSLDP